METCTSTSIHISTVCRLFQVINGKIPSINLQGKGVKVKLKVMEKK